MTVISSRTIRLETTKGQGIDQVAVVGWTCFRQVHPKPFPDRQLFLPSRQSCASPRIPQRKCFPCRPQSYPDKVQALRSAHLLPDLSDLGPAASTPDGLPLCSPVAALALLADCDVDGVDAGLSPSSALYRTGPDSLETAAGAAKEDLHGHDQLLFGTLR